MSSARTFAEALIALDRELGAERAVSAVVSLLNERSMLSLVPAIIGSLEKIGKREENLGAFTLETSHDVSDSLIEKIRGYVGAEGASAVEHHVNSELIGGFRAEYRGKRFDASARGMIQRLKHELLS